MIFFLHQILLSPQRKNRSSENAYEQIVLALLAVGASTRWLLYTKRAPSAWLNFALCGLAKQHLSIKLAPLLASRGKIEVGLVLHFMMPVLTRKAI